MHLQLKSEQTEFVQLLFQQLQTFFLIKKIFQSHKLNYKNQVSLKEFTISAGGIASVWYELDMKGYYLPHLSSSVMTSEYLVKFMRGKIFRIEQKNIQKYTFLQKSLKVDLYVKLNELIQKNQLKDLRFTVGNLPKKKWLISVLYALNPMDQVFLKQCWASEKRGFRRIIILSRLPLQLDTTLFRTKKLGFLQRTEEQRIAIAEKKSEQNLQLLKQKLDKKRFDLLHSPSLLANMKRRESQKR